VSLHWQDGHVEVAKCEGMDVWLQVRCQFMHLAGAGQPCCTVGLRGRASRVVQLGWRGGGDGVLCAVQSALPCWLYAL
jgi:hypothetical protein